MVRKLKDKSHGNSRAKRGKSTPAPRVAKLPTYLDKLNRTAQLVANTRGKSIVTIDFSAATMKCELTIQDQPIIAGPMPSLLTVDCETQSPHGAWEVVHWETAGEADHLELQQLLGNWQLHRRFVLAREDQILLISNRITGGPVGQLYFENSLTLAGSASCQAATETREIELAAGRRRVRAIPLNLPEWRAQLSSGELACGTEVVTSRDTRHACGLCVLVLLDLDPHRARNSLTWRKLTVAEKLQTVPDDVAVGYRAQLGTRQWLCYQSIGDCGNRTVLGQNLIDEFLLARFGEKGKTEDLIRILPSDPENKLDLGSRQVAGS